MLFEAIIILTIFIVIFLTTFFSDITKATKSPIHRRKYKVGSSITAYLMLLPACILAFLFILLPIIYSLGYAFTDYYSLEPENVNFIFVDNFIEIVRDFTNKGDLYYAVRNTALFVICVVPLQIGMALALALFCNTKKPGTGIFKVCFFAPVVISLTVTSYLWLHILSPSETGLLNSFLGLFGIPSQDFLGNEDTAILWIVILSAWQGCGFQMLIFLSALTNIRKDLYEAAALDGAGSWGKFWHVTMPALKPTFLYVLITVFIGACRIMVQPMIMVGYHKRVITISYYMFQIGFNDRWVGLSSAVALLMTIFIGGITLLQRKLLGEKD